MKPDIIMQNDIALAQQPRASVTNGLPLSITVTVNNYSVTTFKEIHKKHTFVDLKGICHGLPY
jgi:hypothetical protein